MGTWASPKGFCAFCPIADWALALAFRAVWLIKRTGKEGSAIGSKGARGASPQSSILLSKSCPCLARSFYGPHTQEASGWRLRHPTGLPRFFPGLHGLAPFALAAAALFGFPFRALPDNRPKIAAAASAHIGASGATTLGGFTFGMRADKPERFALCNEKITPGHKKAGCAHTPGCE